MKKIALCYDFDGTLCSDYMQNQKLIPDCKIDAGKFWTEVTKNSKKNKIDPTLSYLFLLENKMHDAKIEISKENFNKYGKKLKLFPGVMIGLKELINLEKNIMSKSNIT